ncbi:MAG: phosphotransferase [Pseudonocardiales bacterium]
MNAAQRAAEAAARAADIDPAGLTLVRGGENMILLMPSAQAVARVAPSIALLDSVRRELRVATWLAEAGLCTVRPLAREPFVDGELVVSFWEYLPEIEATDLVTLAGFLRQLHTTPIPQEFQLDPVRPFVRITERIESAPTLAEADRQFLRAMQVDLVTQWGRATASSPAVV